MSENERYPFDLKLALAGDELVYRDGKPVPEKFQEDGRAGEYPCYLETNNGLRSWHTKEGKSIVGSEYDLFMRYPAKSEFTPGIWIRRQPGYQPETVWLVGFDPGGDAVVQFPDGLFITDINTWEPVPPTRKVTTWIRKYITGHGQVYYMTELSKEHPRLSDEMWSDEHGYEWKGKAYSETHEIEVTDA